MALWLSWLYYKIIDFAVQFFQVTILKISNEKKKQISLLQSTRSAFVFKLYTLKFIGTSR